MDHHCRGRPCNRRRGRSGGALGSEIALLRAVHLFKVGSVAAAHGAASRVLDLERDKLSFPRTVASCLLGITHYWCGLRGPLRHQAITALEEGR